MSPFPHWFSRKKRSRAWDPGPPDSPAAQSAAAAPPVSAETAEIRPAPNLARAQRIRLLLERGPDEVRRIALDESDRAARETNTFGSKQHRAQRDRIEQEHDEARRTCERLSDDELDRALNGTA